MTAFIDRRRTRIATLSVLWVCLVASVGAAETDPADVSLLEDPPRLRLTIPVIPVREDEVWFRDAWNVRINAGYETDKDLGQIATGSVEINGDSSSLIGIDIGRPLVDDWLDWPIDFAWRTGLQRWLDHGAGANGFAQTAYLKMYVRPFPWEHLVSTRIGIGEGLSYAWRVPEVESQWATDHGEQSNHLLNYLDVSLDLNVGDMIRNESARACTLGLVISHRSGVFGLVDIFGNVHNGSNYNTAALECGF